MKRSIPIALLLIVGLTGFLVPVLTHHAKAQDAPPAVLSPTEIIDQIMSRIGQGRIDDAVGMMEGLKNQGDLQQAARNRLITLRDDQGQYHGYDVAAVQRYTPQLQTVDVLAYYDNQPVLFRFHFYRPVVANGGKWAILGFQVSTAVQEMADILKDTPVDYVGNRAAKGAGQ
jgi:hypothetical protein